MIIAQADVALLPKPVIVIGERELETATGGVHEHVYAATGAITGEIPLAGVLEIDAAVTAARAGFDRWSRLPAPERRNILLRLATLLERDAGLLAQLSVIDNAIPISVAQYGPHVAADSFRYNAGWADKIGGELLQTWPVPALDYSMEEPYGVVAVIIPWNGPVYALGMVLAPALAAGNAVVVKPPELAPYAALQFGRICLEAGIPEGVVTVVPGGATAGAALTSHPGVDKIHFTGSGTTAGHILTAASKNMTPVQLELGGKSAALIFNDADLESLDAFLLSGVINNSGQGCINATRLLVQDDIYDAVVERAAAIASKIALGDPTDPSTNMGPVIAQNAADRIMGMVADAKCDGGRLVFGGKRGEGPLSGGYYVEPTVFADVDPRSRLAQNEVFGPILAISRFETQEQAVGFANSTEFGLAGYVWTSDIKRAHNVAKSLAVGNVWVNGFAGIPTSVPFGGVRASGFGRLGGVHGIREFTRPKNVWVAL